MPSDVRYSKNINPLEKLLYAEITCLSNYKGFCWATNNYFANTELYEPTATTNEEAKKITGDKAEEFIAENVTLIAAGAMDMDGNLIGEFTE